MKSNDSDNPDTTLEEEATLWLLEREEGFQAGRAEAFAEWQRRDPRHRVVLAEVEHTLSILNKMPAIRQPVEARIGRTTADTPQTALARREYFKTWVWAASMAAVLVLGIARWRIEYSKAPAPESYVASENDPRRVSLPDGSVVDLNANSKIEIRFSESERRITLETGEAHFQVAHNSARPFIVRANGVSVRAVGTAFNICLTEENVDVLVAEGKVEVDRVVASMFSSNRQVTVVPLLVAGERTQIMPTSGSAPRVEKVAPAILHSLLSWQNRMTSFADVPLSEMVARINRCNVRQLVIGDPELGNRKVGGVINLNQVNAFLHLLEQYGDIVSEQGSGGEIILRRAR